MQIDLFSVPLIIGFVNAWIIAIILLFRGFANKRYSDILISTILIAVSILLLPYMFGYMGINVLWNELLFFPRDTSFIIGPLIYFYLRAQINTNFRLRIKDSIHFLPFLLYVLYHLTIFFQGREFVVEWTSKYNNAEVIMLLFMFISMICYFVATLLLYRSYRRWLKQELPDYSVYSFSWFNAFLIATLLTIIIMWTFTFINIFGYALDYNQNVWQYIFLSAILTFIGLRAYAQRQPNFMDYTPSSLSSTKAETSIIQVDSDADIKQKIVDAMEIRKLYLNADLSLGMMATEIDEPKATVSRVINGAFAQNFREFVNVYRVRAVCESLEKEQHKKYSLLGVAMNAGFNSKATFNRVFKEELKMTPLQYADNCLK